MALIVIGVLAVLALIGGGVYALTSGGGGAEELDDDEFADRASEICSDAEDDLDELGEDVFGDIDDPDDLSDDDLDALEDFADEAEEVTGELFSSLREIAPEGDADEWGDVVDEWESVFGDLFARYRDGELEPTRRLESRVEDLFEELEDRNIECLGAGGMTMVDPVEPPDPEPVEPDPPSTTDPEGGEEVDHGPPTEPPAFDDPELTAQGDDCYEGDMEACTDIYIASGFDTPEETYGQTCGGRTAEDDFVYCPDIEDPIVP